jgi:hypothetical protein
MHPGKDRAGRVASHRSGLFRLLLCCRRAKPELEVGGVARQTPELETQSTILSPLVWGIPASLALLIVAWLVSLT